MEILEKKNYTYSACIIQSSSSSAIEMARGGRLSVCAVDTAMSCDLRVIRTFDFA